MEHKDYELQVPEGYSLAYHINASDKKTGVLMTIGAVVIMIAAVALVFLGIPRPWSFGMFASDIRYFLFWAVWLVLEIAYIILHELTHGAVYKALTHQKLRFGITWNAAFCGVPDIYTYRRVAILSLIAPLTVFTIIFVALALYLRTVSTPWYLVVGILFATHISGCVGDMFMTFKFLTKYKDPRTLMRDTGPEQWIYVPEESLQE
jgi:hypothetical protein